MIAERDFEIEHISMESSDLRGRVQVYIGKVKQLELALADKDDSIASLKVQAEELNTFIKTLEEEISGKEALL